MERAFVEAHLPGGSWTGKARAQGDRNSIDGWRKKGGRDLKRREAEPGLVSRIPGGGGEKSSSQEVVEGEAGSTQHGRDNLYNAHMGEGGFEAGKAWALGEAAWPSEEPVGGEEGDRDQDGEGGREIGWRLSRAKERDVVVRRSVAPVRFRRTCLAIVLVSWEYLPYLGRVPLKYRCALS